MGIVATRVRPEASARWCGFCGIEISERKRSRGSGREDYCAEHRGDAARLGWCDGRKTKGKK